jgi:flagellar biosynthesis repressor protein FlbT
LGFHEINTLIIEVGTACMSLKITLKPHEKIIINQAVIVNGKTKCELILENQAAVLRKKDILGPDEVKTPAQYLYFLLQCLYLFHEENQSKKEEAQNLLKEMIDGIPSLRECLNEIKENFETQNYYQALKSGQKLIQQEEEKFKNVLYEQSEKENALYEPSSPTLK